MIDYIGYLVDDSYFTYYPHDDCKHIDIYIGTKLSVPKYESINGFVKVILEDGKLVWVKEKYITKDIIYKENIINDNGNKRYMDWECITDPSNIYAIDGSITEFIVNTSSLPEQARLYGGVSYASEDLTGRVISIKILKLRT